MSREPASDRDHRGYRVRPGAGATIRADVIDLYIVRRKRRTLSFLQLLRTKTPLDGTWQPVMGHIEAGETAAGAAAREGIEEVGLDVFGPSALGFYALEQVHPFYIAAIDCIVLSPRFVVEVGTSWLPRLNREHEGHRWVAASRARDRFLWPGQWAAIREIVEILTGPAATRESLRLPRAALRRQSRG